MTSAEAIKMAEVEGKKLYTSALIRKYISRKPNADGSYGVGYKYSGKYGTGYAVEMPNNKSTRYSFIHYYV